MGTPTGRIPIDESTRLWLKRVAAQTDRSMHEIARTAIRAHLRKFKVTP